MPSQKCISNWTGGCRWSKTKGVHLLVEKRIGLDSQDRKWPQLDEHKYTRVVVCDRILQIFLAPFQSVFLFHSKDETYN